MFQQAAAIKLSKSQMQQLQSLAQAGTTPQRVAQRCRVVLLAGQGIANHSIARQTGLSRPTVISTRAEFARGGVAALQQPRQRKRTGEGADTGMGARHS